MVNVISALPLVYLIPSQLFMYKVLSVGILLQRDNKLVFATWTVLYEIFYCSITIRNKETVPSEILLTWILYHLVTRICISKLF